MKQNFIAFSVFVLLANPLFGQWVKTAFPCDCTVQDVHVRGDDVFAFGLGTGMMRSSDQGQTWEDAMTGITSFLVKKIASNDQYLFAAIPIDHLVAGYYFVVVRSDLGMKMMPFVVAR